MAREKRVLGIVLAGGEGKRLMPLTADRAKPAVPFGGSFRLVDFVLSNMVNAGFLKIAVLTQYKSHSLDRHISLTWRMSSLLGNYVTPVPAQQRLGPRWYLGSADAIFQSLNLLTDEQPDQVVVFGADHVYRMDPGQMLRQHIDSGVAVTVAGIRMPRKEADQFGVIEVESEVPGSRRISRFLEKPADPPGIPGEPDTSFVSMGNYIFNAEALIDALRTDAADENSKHDMGGNIIPMLVGQGQADVYDFADNVVPGQGDRERGYWRDVGTIDAYHASHMDLVSIDPEFSLYNRQWPMYTYLPQLPGAKFVEGGNAHESVVGQGSIVAGGYASHSVLSPDVRVDRGAHVAESVLMHGVRVGEGAVLRRAIVDKGVQIPPGATLGVNLDRDRELYTVTESGIVVVGKGQKVLV